MKIFTCDWGVDEKESILLEAVTIIANKHKMKLIPLSLDKYYTSKINELIDLQTKFDELLKQTNFPAKPLHDAQL